MMMGGAVLTKGVFIACGYYAGSWLDRVLDTAPWCMISGLVASLILGFWWLIRVANRVGE